MKNFGRFFIEMKNSLIGAAGLVGITLGWITLGGASNDDKIQWLGWAFFAALIIVFSETLFKSQRHGSRDEDDVYDSQVFVVTSESKLYEHLYESKDSVVKGAKEFIYATGSRSRDVSYLNAIEESLRNNRKLHYCRVLFGPPLTGAMISHINNTLSIAYTRKKASGTPPIRISQIPLNGSMSERFVVCSEKKAVLALQSLNTATGYDTAVVIESEVICKQLANRVREFAASNSAVRIDKKLDPLVEPQGAPS